MVRSRAQMNEGGAAAAVSFAGQGKRFDLGMTAQGRMHRLAQLSDPFSMNNPHLQEPLCLTGSQILEQNLFHILGTECVQIQDTINRQWKRFVHRKGHPHNFTNSASSMTCTPNFCAFSSFEPASSPART